ncbi:MAG: TetR/AcrR family transcriptional regulator [Anaerolineae bacterium]|jgi:TetR/AcrR family transcriptional repressor of nem operon|nr:TetR/AcrR family transcriptional regulator [Anaerolineae bacterium]
MRKSEHTRAVILAQAAELFNINGYSGTSMSDIMRATGLEKGGIYNHFPGGKEELAVAAFDYAYRLIRLKFVQTLRAAGKRPSDKLLVAVTFHMTMIKDPVIAGGCPILNTAIESDDTSPALKAAALAALEEWHTSLRDLAARAEERGELRLPMPPDALANLLISALEGAVMVSKLRGTARPLREVIHYWQTVLEAGRISEP